MILDDIVADKKKRLLEQKQLITPDQMEASARQSLRVSRSFYNALSKKGLSIIGEFKMASPSLGAIHSKIPLENRIAQYNESVDAISCLTEEDHFNGSAEYLQKIRKITDLPILRKDFMIDEYQIYEAKVIGADAILLIAAILTDDDMEYFYRLSYELGMDVLLEVHNEEEMERAQKIHPKIVGINNRNLKDFSIDLSTTKRLSKYRGDSLLVSESGVTDSRHIEYLKECDVDALLIGRAFMEDRNPQALAKEWKGIYDK